MSFLKSLFGQPSTEKLMATLLTGPGRMLADETERVYRGQIEAFSEDSHPCDLDAKGVLKARLFGVSFIPAIFRMQAGSSDRFMDMVNACSGLAMLPFESPTYKPSINRDVALSFASDYMTRVIKSIFLDLEHGAGEGENKNNGRIGLYICYEEALKDSFGLNNYTREARLEYFPIIMGTVDGNLRFMYENIQR